MKLKKIASLALAGVMAVSMLAGCNTTSNNQPNVPNMPEEPTTSNVTQSVLDKTSEALQKKLSVYDDTKLDQAVAFAAANNIYETFANSLKVLRADGGFVTDASTIMKGGDIQAYTANPSAWNFDAVTKDQTYWTMFAVSRTKSDEWITNEVAEWMDQVLVNQFSDDTQHSNFEYSVRVTMADCVGYNVLGDNKDAASTVIIGIAVSCDNLADNH